MKVIELYLSFHLGDTCIDKEDCSLYGKDYACSGEFRDWATINCPRYCGICDGIYNRTSIARLLMARLPRLFRTPS